MGPQEAARRLRPARGTQRSAAQPCARKTPELRRAHTAARSFQPGTPACREAAQTGSQKRGSSAAVGTCASGRAASRGPGQQWASAQLFTGRPLYQARRAPRPATDPNVLDRLSDNCTQCTVPQGEWRARAAPRWEVRCQRRRPRARPVCPLQKARQQRRPHTLYASCTCGREGLMLMNRLLVPPTSALTTRASVT